MSITIETQFVTAVDSQTACYLNKHVPQSLITQINRLEVMLFNLHCNFIVISFLRSQNNFIYLQKFIFAFNFNFKFPTFYFITPKLRWL